MARSVFEITGTDTEHFLQGLVTNDVSGLSETLVYTAMLTPQGKYLADFFLARRGDAVLLDVDAELAPALLARLNMYKLRADVAVAETDLHLHRGTGPAPEDAMADPRHDALGWRAYRDAPQEEDTTDWDALRVAHCIPETGVELTPDTFILEAGFERLHGVDFRKGCFVGQEVTARMKHKTELRKGLATVTLTGPAPAPGTPIEKDGRAVGTLFTASNGKALAHLRFDRAGEDMQAGDAIVSWTAT
ncbi:YgfZ/GcvT domain-containing protein [Shimia sp. FJ5]|uniref:CAF17-like 4Fe-4S cluster assembly/insertion protein YgfZ n=1 Tax=Shimia sp. FJ5 TaxID=3079054 RepID=UPI00260AD7DA|nr:folate-binding protein [Shimia sp. FJ5]MDV4146017.1 folate-binding protein [Shimia sp. FJ5]